MLSEVCGSLAAQVDVEGVLSVLGEYRRDVICA